VSLTYQHVDEVQYSVPRRVCGDDDDCGEFAVDGGDHGEYRRGLGLGNHNHGVYGLRGLPRRAVTVEGVHQDAEIEACDADHIAFVDILASAKPDACRRD